MEWPATMRVVSDDCPRCGAKTAGGWCGRCHAPIAFAQFPLHRRLGFMAEAMVSAKVGPQARFFTRERVDEIVLLLREAEKALLEKA